MYTEKCFERWESVKELQFLCERLDLIYIYSLKN